MKNSKSSRAKIKKKEIHAREMTIAKLAIALDHLFWNLPGWKPVTAGLSFLEDNVRELPPHDIGVRIRPAGWLDPTSYIWVRLRRTRAMRSKWILISGSIYLPQVDFGEHHSTFSFNIKDNPLTASIEIVAKGTVEEQLLAKLQEDGQPVTI